MSSGLSVFLMKRTKLVFPFSNSTGVHKAKSKTADKDQCKNYCDEYRTKFHSYASSPLVLTIWSAKLMIKPTPRINHKMWEPLNGPT